MFILVVLWEVLTGIWNLFADIMGINLNMKYSLRTILLLFRFMLSAILGGIVDWLSLWFISSLTMATCNVTGMCLLGQVWYDCCSHFPSYDEEWTVRVLPSVQTTHFITQKENFNKTSKGSAAIFKGRFPTKEVHGNSKRKLLETPWWEWPSVIPFYCLPVTTVLMWFWQAALFSCSQCCLMSFSWLNIFISDLLQTIN